MAFATALAFPARTEAQALPAQMKQAFQKELRASPEQIATLENGGIIAYLMEQPNPEEVALVGAARIWVSPDKFIAAYRDISKFESSPSVLAGSKFSNPPKESDLAGLRLAKGEVDDLLNCKPGDCDFKVSDRVLEELKKKINRSSPQYVDDTNRLVRQLWIDYLRRYQASGDSSLAVYHDTPKYASVQKGVEDLIQQSAVLRKYSPQIMNYLRQYPAGKLPESEEFFYWQVGDLGLKPVHRASHVVIAKAPSEFGVAYVIASKMLFASHYFRSAVELRYVIPGQDQKKGGMHYLITVQRSYVDGLTGLKGHVLKPIVLRKSQESMERYIGSVKDRLEEAAKKSQPGE